MPSFETAISFLSEDFLLQSESARILYHQYAKDMPIIDYHNHLPPDEMAADKQFKNLTQIWLYGDHYKWRAMRANGVDESYCTGAQADREKFRKWAETVPYTMRNPLYHWTHLELQRYFDIHDLLNAETADEIYDRATEQLQTPDFSALNLLRGMNVKALCTTDDPCDGLEHHRALQGADLQVLPAYRPDKAMNVDHPATFNAYVDRLEQVCNTQFKDFDAYLEGLKKRHDFFASMGCKVSDHGLEQIYAADYTEADLRAIFIKIRGGVALSSQEVAQFKSGMLVYFGTWDWEKGWVQQFHLGALRNNNTRALRNLGPDTGWDSIGDFEQGRTLSKFLDRLDNQDQLAKTILYNLNPRDNELMATMAGNFNDGSVAGKVQWGSGWWFLDQKDGMEKQINTLSNMGLLSQFVGMLTDSRSFLSFPRHEYFRRILCNLLGQDIENGELPRDYEWIGKMVQDICYNNAKQYFGF
jgi:glucuronate isomerase